ncbi:hypothetical protein [Paludibacterium yongneupense]|uniref:hypothetical protein n=1 Tax=Paludibacterium yongneupense TaxID=400061 RepID=UPI00041259A3|nr:hypothetical protein [Paludibacterium yongneupense]
MIDLQTLRAFVAAAAVKKISILAHQEGGYLLFINDLALRANKGRFPRQFASLDTLFRLLIAVGLQSGAVHYDLSASAKDRRTK